MEERVNSLKMESQLKSFLPVMKKVSVLLKQDEDSVKINDTVNTLIPVAQSVLRASEHLVSLANKSATEDTEDDVKLASDKMIKGGRSILMAIQLLKAENGSRRSREHLANSTNKLLAAVLQVLQVLKSSRIQTILQSAERVQQTLRDVCSVTDIKILVPTFQGFTKAVLRFAGLCERHKSGMSDNVQKEKLSANLKSLKKLIPALKSVIQNQVKYPRNVHAKASCELIEKHVRLAVDSVVWVIQGQVKQKPSKREGKEIQNKETDGHFASDVAMLVHLLSPKHRQSIGGDLPPLVSRLIRHSMMVAVTSREDLKAEITYISQQVLEMLKQVIDRHRALEDNLNYSQLANDFNQSCEKLAREVLSLESFIRSAVIHQVVDVLVQTTEPMNRLVKATTVHVKDGQLLKDEDCLNVLQPLDDGLHDHMDRLCQVGSFVAAGCADVDKIEKVEKSIAAIDELDPDVLPSCLAVRRDSRNKAAMSHLQLVYQEWCQEVQSLVDGIFQTLDLHRFLEISEVCLESDLEDCRHAALIPDEDFLAESINKMLGRTKQVMRVGKDIQNGNEDPIYRNGIQVFLDQIENAVPLVRNSAHYAVKNVTNPRAQKQLKERAQHLIEAVHLLKEGIDSKNQPGLMSPLRQNVRKAPTPQNSVLENDGDVPVVSTHTSSVLSSSREMKNLPTSSFKRTPSPRIATSLHGGSHRGTKQMRDDDSYQFDATPQSKLHLVFPAGDIVRSVFKQEKDELEDFLTQLKEKSTSLVGIAEAVSKLQSLERHILPVSGLMTATETVVSSSLKALSGNDVLQAECLIAADKWSSLYAEMERKIITSLHPEGDFLEFMTDMANPVEKLQKEIGSLKRFQDRVSQMVSTVLQTKDPEKVDALITDIEQHASEWNTLTSEILKQASQLNLNPGNQSLKDRFSFGRLRWMIKLHGLLESVVKHLKERQELWRDVISGGKKWMSSEELRDSISKMKMQTDIYIKLTDLVGSCVPRTTEVDKMVKVKGDLDKLSQTLMYYRGYTVTGEGSFHLESAVTYVGLLEWCAVMQHLCDYLDRLSADIGLRIDRLLSSAHAANSSSGPSKQHFLSELQGQSDALSLVVTQTRQLTVSALMASPSHTLKTIVLTSIDELSRLTPKLLSLTRDLADSKLQSLSELNHVKRLWLCHSTGIVGSLQLLPLVEGKKIEEIQRLLRGSLMMSSMHQFSVNEASLPRASQSASIPRASQSAFIPVSQPHKTFTPLMYPHHMSPHPHAFSVDASSLDVSLTHTPVDHIFSPHPSQRLLDPQRLLGGDPTVHTTGQAGGLYTDSSYSWQGMEPRLVTSQTKTAKTQRSKPYRSRTLGLEELPIKSASTSSLPSATARPSLQRTDSMKCYSSIEATALMLQQEADRWEKDDNQYIQAIKQLAENMNILTKFAKRPDSGTPKPELISAARAIAAEACNIHRFAEIITRHARDKKLAEELQIHCKQIPALATQLNIISTVKTATPEDYKSDVVIVTNAEKLMEAVVKTLKASETLCVKGLKIIEPGTPEEAAAASLAAQWKRKLHRHRQIEASSPDVDGLGLRRISKNTSMPSLTEMFQRGLRS